MKTRIRPRTTSPRIVNEIQTLAIQGYTWAAISRTLELKFGGEAPSERTVQNILREWRGTRSEERWSFAEDADPDAAVVLPTLRGVMNLTVGRIASFSPAEASWIKKVYRLCPALEPELIYVVSLHYLAAGDDTTGLDVTCAYLLSGWDNEPDGRERSQEYLAFLRSREDARDEAGTSLAYSLFLAWGLPTEDLDEMLREPGGVKLPST